MSTKNILTKVIATFLIILMMNMNCYAVNWVTITAENGKSGDLNLDSIKMAVDTVEYDIKVIQNDYTYINRFSTELYEDGTPTALISSKKYKGDTLVSSEVYKERNYRTLKAGTLQAEIFDVLSKELSEKTFNDGQNSWEKYLNKQRKLIQQKWHPGSFKNLSKKNINNTLYTTPVYISTVSLKIDKDGNIQEKYTDDYYLNEVSKLDPLPDGYTGETFDLSINMNYYKYAGAKTKTQKPLVKQHTPTKATVTIAKNNRPPVIGHISLGLMKALKTEWMDVCDNMPFLLQLLLIIPIAIGEIAIKIPLCILYLITGGDYDDI